MVRRNAPQRRESNAPQVAWVGVSTMKIRTDTLFGMRTVTSEAAVYATLHVYMHPFGAVARTAAGAWLHTVLPAVSW